MIYLVAALLACGILAATTETIYRRHLRHYRRSITTDADTQQPPTTEGH